MSSDFGAAEICFPVRPSVLEVEPLVSGNETRLTAVVQLIPKVYSGDEVRAVTFGHNPPNISF